MNSNQMLRSSVILTRLCYHRFLPRLASTASKEPSSTQNKSKSKGGSGKSSGSEYLAADMYNYTTFSYYDMETNITSYRLPQPSPYVPVKSPEPAPQKK